MTEKGKEVPLKGLMELIAVGRMLADTDLLGFECDNVGLVWIKENKVITGARIVKVDPGKGCTFSSTAGTRVTGLNWVLNTKYRLPLPVPGFSARYLNDVKDIQTAQSGERVIIYWKALTDPQRDIFLRILFDMTQDLQLPNLLDYLFHREGKLQHVSEETIRKIQKDIQEQMKEWIKLQLEIYAEDLKEFHQKYSEGTLNAGPTDLKQEVF